MDNLQLPSPQSPAPWQQLLQQWLQLGREFVQTHRTQLLALVIFLGGNVTGYLYGHRPRHHSVKIAVAKAAPAAPAKAVAKASAKPKASKKEVAKAQAKRKDAKVAKKPAKKSSAKLDDSVFAGR